MKTYLRLILICCVVGFTSACSDDDSNPIPNPVLSVEPGTYNNSFQLQVNTGVPNYTVYYTNDGSTPTTESLKVLGGIPIFSNATNNISILVGDQIITAQYVLKAADPEFTLASGGYEFQQLDSIISETELAKIYYTTDGTDPTTDSKLYEGAIDINGDVNEIRAIAVKDGYQNSNIVSIDYSVGLEQPVSSVYWYSAADAVPVGTSTPFGPSAVFESSYDVTVNNSDIIAAIPTGFDAIVMADNFSSEFNLGDFEGKVIVTFDNSIEALLNDMLEGDDNMNYWKENYWDSTSEPMINWANPADWPAESAIPESAVISASAIAGNVAAGVTFTRRADIIEGLSGDPDDEEVTPDDAVIVYEVKKGEKQWYWVHIGPLAGDRGSEVLDYVLDELVR